MAVTAPAAATSTAQVAGSGAHPRARSHPTAGASAAVTNSAITTGTTIGSSREATKPARATVAASTRRRQQIPAA